MAERNFGACPAMEDECGFTVLGAEAGELTGGPQSYCERAANCAAPLRDVEAAGAVTVSAMAALEALPDAVAAQMGQRLAGQGGM